MIESAIAQNQEDVDEVIKKLTLGSNNHLTTIPSFDVQIKNVIKK